MKNSFVLAGLIFAGIGSASTLTFLGTNIGSTVSIAGVYNGDVFAGKLDFNDTTLGNIKTFCSDLQHIIHAGQSWQVAILDSANQSQNIADAGRIVAAEFANANTADKAAGLQMAVWEAVYDDGAIFNPNQGTFRVTNASAAAISYASTFYGMRNQNGHSIYLLPSSNSEGQGQLTPVPEPATLAALGILGLIAGRRKRN
ncbi:MAG: PEP-CTERM sorting domain-containing protein [Armatimonadetes bacterium]|nr:PEP-CTERM sorting domain-containing protein [Armatimonadota bacterium]